VDDAEALDRAGGAILAVAPEMEGRLQVELGAANANLSVVGTWPSYFEVNNFRLAGGRLFSAAEDRGRRRVAVLGALAGDALGVPTATLLGQRVRVGGVPFEVVGVLEEKGAQGFFNPDEGVYLPLGTAQLRVMGSDSVRSIGVQATSAAGMDQAMVEIDRVLRREHRLAPGEEADFNVRDQASLLATMQETTQTFSFLLAGIAAISLLVGGIGIMNIMLVSVTERTREIGLRKALGARRRQVLGQFLLEAVLLCNVGGLLGVLVGYALGNTVTLFTDFALDVPLEWTAIGLGFCSAVGLTFGMWPAVKASRLEPIEALRYE
jgi:putative ABC transport system permease protein